MEKRISFDQFQSVKRVAQACNPLMVKESSPVKAAAVAPKSMLWSIDRSF